MNEQKFIPQAIVSVHAKTIIYVFHNERIFNDFWKGRVPTVDAPGVQVHHPADIKIGDIIADNEVGWNCFKVAVIEFHPNDLDRPGLHRAGYYSFSEYKGGSKWNTRIDGRNAIDRPYYIFPSGFTDPSQTPAHQSKP